MATAELKENTKEKLKALRSLPLIRLRNPMVKALL